MDVGSPGEDESPGDEDRFGDIVGAGVDEDGADASTGGYGAAGKGRVVIPVGDVAVVFAGGLVSLPGLLSGEIQSVMVGSCSPVALLVMPIVPINLLLALGALLLLVA